MSDAPLALLVGTSPSSAPLLRSLHTLGFEVIGVDRDPTQLPVDFEIPNSIHEWDMIGATCKDLEKSQKRISGVISRASGPGMVSASLFASRLGLPGYSEILAKMANSKTLLFRNLSDLRVPTPTVLRNEGQIVGLIRATGRVVVKPEVPLVGKKSVSVVSDEFELDSAVALAERASHNGAAIVQPFIPGDDYALVTYSRGQEIVWSACFRELVFSRDGSFFGGGFEYVASAGASWMEEMVNIAARVLAKWPSEGTAVFSFRKSGENLYLYEINLGMVGDGLFERYWASIWPDDDPFMREVLTLLGRETRLPQIGEIGRPLNLGR